MNTLIGKITFNDSEIPVLRNASQDVSAKQRRC